MQAVPKPQKPTAEEKLQKKLSKLQQASEKKISKLKERIKKKPKKKAKSQVSLKSLRDKAWRLFSRIVREEENYICYTCGKNLQNDKSNCHAGHYVPRGKVSALRYDRRNVHAQCNSCNLFMSGNLSVYAVKLEAQYGMGILQEFDRIRHNEDTIGEFKVEKINARVELLDMIEKYKARLAEMGVDLRGKSKKEN